MRKLFVAIVLLSVFYSLSQAKVYKCTDQAGNEVYNSDGGPNCTLLYGSEAEEEPVAPEEVHPVEGVTYAELWARFDAESQPLWPVVFEFD